MLIFLKRFAGWLPRSIQTSLKRLHFARQIRKGRFVADEPEATRLGEFLSPGDWALDVGANVGHYTLAMSEVVGSKGRVIAFEPMRSTFAVLSANVEHSRFQNITLVNAAASSRTGILFMDMPVDSRTGLDNPYQAQVCADGEFSILGLSIDGMELDGPIKLVKIDAEGHEIDVLRGMERLLDRLGPALIVEGDDSQVEAFLTSRRYTFSVMPDSWNRIYERQR